MRPDLGDNPTDLVSDCPHTTHMAYCYAQKEHHWAIGYPFHLGEESWDYSLFRLSGWQSPVINSDYHSRPSLSSASAILPPSGQ